MFPLSNIENKIQTRNCEMFEVQKANTERLKKICTHIYAKITEHACKEVKNISKMGDEKNH